MSEEKQDAAAGKDIPQPSCECPPNDVSETLLKVAQSQVVECMTKANATVPSMQTTEEAEPLWPIDRARPLHHTKMSIRMGPMSMDLKEWILAQTAMPAIPENKPIGERTTGLDEID